jgi:hypothetical protein
VGGSAVVQLSQRLDWCVVEPSVLKESPPMRVVSEAFHAEVHRAPHNVRGIAADVVPQQVVRQQEVSGPSSNLLGLGQPDRWIAGRLEERFRPVLAEVVRVGQMGSGSYPQVAGVLIELVGHQDPSQERERPWSAVRLRRRRAVDMVPAGSVGKRRDVQRNLHLPRHLKRAGSGQRLGQGERRTLGQQGDQRRNIRRPGPVEVIPADGGTRRPALDQRIDSARCGRHEIRRHCLRDHHEAAFGELSDLLATKHGCHARSPMVTPATRFWPCARTILPLPIPLSTGVSRGRVVVVGGG